MAPALYVNFNENVCISRGFATLRIRLRLVVLRATSRLCVFMLVAIRTTLIVFTINGRAKRQYKFITFILLSLHVLHVLRYRCFSKQVQTCLKTHIPVD